MNVFNAHTPEQCKEIFILLIYFLYLLSTNGTITASVHSGISPDDVLETMPSLIC